MDGFMHSLVRSRQQQPASNSLRHTRLPASGDIKVSKKSRYALERELEGLIGAE